MTDTSTDTTAHADLVAALGALDEVARGKTAKVETRGGGSYAYTYADLGAALSAVRPCLAAHGLAIVQPVETDEGWLRVSTVLVHRSGERFGSPSLIVRQPDGAQALGSMITYLRRYSLLASLGLATDDDDGRAATPAPSTSQEGNGNSAPRTRGVRGALFAECKRRWPDDADLKREMIALAARCGAVITTRRDIDDALARRMLDDLNNTQPEEETHE